MSDATMPFAGGMEKLAATALRDGMSPAELYYLIGVFVGYAVANAPQSDRDDVQKVLDVVAGAAWEAADIRFSERGASVQ